MREQNYKFFVHDCTRTLVRVYESKGGGGIQRSYIWKSGLFYYFETPKLGFMTPKNTEFADTINVVFRDTYARARESRF